MPEKKKKGFIDYIFYGFYAVVALAIIAAAVLVGYSLDMTMTDEGEIDGLAAVGYIETVMETPQTAFTYALNEEKSNARRMVLYAVVAIGLFAAYKMTSKKRFHRKGVEHGSAKWGGDKERKILEDSKELYNNIIYADDIYLVLDRKRREANNPKAYKRKKQSTPKQVDDSKKLAIKKDNSAVQKVQAMLNLNAVVIGGTGTGKSRFFVKPNLLQCNTSFVVTDPSGELLQSCGKMLERNGYEVKCFNLMNMEHSSNYNPFAYLKNYKGEFVADNVIKMINTFMVNTKAEGASGGDQFWDDATRLLLSAICFLITETAEKEEEQNFAQVLDLIRMAKVVEGKEEEKSELDFVFEKRKEAAPKALSVQYYDEFKQAAGKTMQSILISTTTKLQHFKLPNLRNLTHKDTIGLETLGDKKTALFIIIPSTDKTYNFLAAMMYMQLFDTLFDRAIQKYGGRLPFHVRFVLDEFANVGKIPDFETVLATMRKFELSATVILQNLAQLKRLYEKSWEEIPGNCDTMLYLGGKDQSTNEYI
jgi:type IV secretion system protein VirD4